MAEWPPRTLRRCQLGRFPAGGTAAAGGRRAPAFAGSHRSRGTADGVAGCHATLSEAVGRISPAPVQRWMAAMDKDGESWVPQVPKVVRTHFTHIRVYYVSEGPMMVMSPYRRPPQENLHETTFDRLCARVGTRAGRQRTRGFRRARPGCIGYRAGARRPAVASSVALTLARAHRGDPRLRAGRARRQQGRREEGR